MATKFISYGLLGALIIASLLLMTHANEARFIGCFMHAKWTDEPPVRTDGLCVIEYLVRERR